MGGGGDPGGAPAPNDHPSTPPAGGSYALALWLLYVQPPPRSACQ